MTGWQFAMGIDGDASLAQSGGGNVQHTCTVVGPEVHVHVLCKVCGAWMGTIAVLALGLLCSVRPEALGLAALACWHLLATAAVWSTQTPAAYWFHGAMAVMFSAAATHSARAARLHRDDPAVQASQMPTTSYGTCLHVPMTVPLERAATHCHLLYWSTFHRNTQGASALPRS